ncbi:MAG: flagellar basal body P-ring formation chaperone FlgA [Proteobacteria bacterium]|nr:flagellar basal body P-ring formation chaperone FlgA [Pseudomonadota bacterium]
MTATYSIRLLFLAALLMAAAVAVAGAARAAVNDVVIVDDAWITLGDLTGVTGDAAGYRVARAPAPGERGVIPVSDILAAAARNDVRWDPQGLRSVTVIRSSTMIPMATVQTALSAALSQASGGLRLRPEINNSNFVLHVPVDASPTVEVEQLLYDAGRGTFTAMLQTPADGGQTRRTEVRGRALEVVATPVLVNPVARGAVITAADLGWAEFRADRLRADVAVDPAQLIGMSPRRPVRTGEAIPLTDVQAPVLVPRNASVVMIVEIPGMQLTAAGRALNAWALGDTIEVINSHTHATLFGIVEAPGVVRVPMLRNALAAANVR